MLHRYTGAVQYTYVHLRQGILGRVGVGGSLYVCWRRHDERAVENLRRRVDVGRQLDLDRAENAHAHQLHQPIGRRRRRIADTAVGGITATDGGERFVAELVVDDRHGIGRVVLAILATAVTAVAVAAVGLGRMRADIVAVATVRRHDPDGCVRRKSQHALDTV